MILRRTLRMFFASVLLLPLVAAGTTPAEASPHGAGHGRQLLFFNHVYGVLDHETADAIEDSEYLRQFANFQVRTTTGDGRTWSGRYLLGRETYLELFAEGDLPGQDAKLGSGGMGLSTEDAGDLAEVRQRLVDGGVPDPVDFQQTRDFGDGKPIPWFDGVYTTPEYDAFGPWAMEYRSEYFADPRSDTEPASHPGDVGRERYLNDDYRGHLMRDVTSVWIDVSERDLAGTVPLLEAGGFSLHHNRNGTVTATHGGTTLSFHPTTGPAGLRRVALSLNHPVAYRHVEHLGRSTLTVGPGTRAVWTFPAPPA